MHGSRRSTSLVGIVLVPIRVSFLTKLKIQFPSELSKSHFQNESKFSLIMAIAATSSRALHRYSRRAISTYIEPGPLFSATCTDPRVRQACLTRPKITIASKLPEQGILLFSMPSLAELGIKGGEAIPGDKTMWELMKLKQSNDRFDRCL